MLFWLKRLVGEIMDTDDRTLRTMRMQHRAYLQSDTWKEIRVRAFEAHGENCQRCGNPGRDVHHKTYIRWGGRELMDDLEILCRACHVKHHEKERSIKEQSTAKPARKKKRNGMKPRPKKARLPSISLQAALSKLPAVRQKKLLKKFPGQSLDFVAGQRDKHGRKCRAKMASMLGVRSILIS